MTRPSGYPGQGGGLRNSFTPSRRVSKCHSHILPALSQTSAILPLLQSMSVLTFTKLASVRLNSCDKKFQKWNAPHVPGYEKRSKVARSGSGIVHQSSADLFIFSFLLWARDDRMGRFCFCVVASALL